MNPKKAIELLSDSAYRGMTTFNQDFKDAEKLGIEALKVYLKSQEAGRYPPRYKLPGETEGDENELN